MPYKTHKYKRFKSKTAYDKFQAFIHLHNIPHTKHRYVEIKEKGKYHLHRIRHKRD
jgi:hypothetical protein